MPVFSALLDLTEHFGQTKSSSSVYTRKLPLSDSWTPAEKSLSSSYVQVGHFFEKTTPSPYLFIKSFTTTLKYQFT